MLFYYLQLLSSAIFSVSHSQEFDANQDSDTIVYHQLSPPLKARYIRLRPTAWHNHISMRMELYGCEGIIVQLLCSCRVTQTKLNNHEAERKSKIPTFCLHQMKGREQNEISTCSLVVKLNNTSLGCWLPLSW